MFAWCPIRTSTAENVALRRSLLLGYFIWHSRVTHVAITFVASRASRRQLMSPFVPHDSSSCFFTSLVRIAFLVPRTSLSLSTSCHLLSLHVLSCPRVVRHGLCPLRSIHLRRMSAIPSDLKRTPVIRVPSSFHRVPFFLALTSSSSVSNLGLLAQSRPIVTDSATTGIALGSSHTHSRQVETTPPPAVSLLARV
jgi:hypothetical protein